MIEINNIEQLIIRSLDETATPEELELLNQWLNQSAANKAEYFRMKDVWETTSTQPVDNAGHAWDSFKAHTNKPSIIRRLTIEIAKVAAIAAVILAGSYVYFNPSNVDEEIQYAHIDVPYGSKSTIQLPDGTIVKLNAGSQLIYPSSFAADIRNVQLSGEAYFEVMHNAEHPFVVSAGDIDVKVLGTEFNVMAYPEFDRIETTLVNGKVALNKRGYESDNPLILQPGQKATFQNGKLSVAQANLQLETNWTQNQFYFENTSLTELARRLEKWYDVEIIINEDEFKDITFTGKFRNKETIWQVLDAVKLTMPIDYRTEHRKIYIKPLK